MSAWIVESLSDDGEWSWRHFAVSPAQAMTASKEDAEAEAEALASRRQWPAERVRVREVRGECLSGRVVMSRAGGVQDAMILYVRTVAGPAFSGPPKTALAIEADVPHTDGTRERVQIGGRTYESLEDPALAIHFAQALHGEGAHLESWPTAWCRTNNGDAGWRVDAVYGGPQ